MDQGPFLKSTKPSSKSGQKFAHLFIAIFACRNYNLKVVPLHGQAQAGAVQGQRNNALQPGKEVTTRAQWQSNGAAAEIGTLSL